MIFRRNSDNIGCFFLLIGFIAIGISRAFSLPLAPDQKPAPPYDARSIQSLLTTFSKSLKPFDKRRETIVFTTSLQQCAGCCAAAVNDILAEIDRGKWGANIVVLVGTEFPEEVVAVRSLFKHPNIIADVGGKGWKALQAETMAPGMFILGADGSVLARLDDIQHNSVNRSVVNGLRWVIQKPSLLKPSWEVKLKESKESVIVTVESPSIEGRSLLFLDPIPNMIYRFSSLDGKLISRETIEDSVSFRFKHEEDNPWVWSSLLEHISPLNKLYGAVPTSDPNVSRFVASFHTGYDSSATSDGKKMFVLRKQIGVAEVGQGKVSAIAFLDEGKGYISPPIVRDSSGDIVTLYSWHDGRQELTDQVKRDSGFILARASIADSQFMPMLPIRDLERACNATIDPNVSVLHCAGSRGTIFFYDGTNNILGRIDSISDPTHAKIFPLWNAPATSFSAPSHAGISRIIEDSLVSSVSNAPPALLHDRVVTGLAWTSSYLDLISIEDVGKQSVVSIRRMLPDGTIVQEAAFAHGTDAPIEAYPIGYRDGDLMVLVKWQRARWIISGLRLNK